MAKSILYSPKTKPTSIYKSQHKVRIVTATSLFDGHDVSINIMRRLLQTSGCEVIHLGHNRSVDEVVTAAIQEDVQAIALTSYQGGHMEYFKYMYDLLRDRGAGHIKIFGGGGGVILPHEIEELMDYGITRLYSPDDGRGIGLQGMINDVIQKSDFSTKTIESTQEKLTPSNHLLIARLISAIENEDDTYKSFITPSAENKPNPAVSVLGITGTGGAGKSTLTDEIVRRFLNDFPEKTIAIISVDPSKRKTGGALLGDRIRVNSLQNPQVYMRSLATRQSNMVLSNCVRQVIQLLKATEFDFIIIETAGTGQGNTEILDHSDFSLYVMTPEYGAASQLEKINMLDYAHIIAVNKFDKQGGKDALRDVKKQYYRNTRRGDTSPSDKIPVYGTISSQFNDPGTDELYLHLLSLFSFQSSSSSSQPQRDTSQPSQSIIPPHRSHYLNEITEQNRNYSAFCNQQIEIAQQLYGLQLSLNIMGSSSPKLVEELKKTFNTLRSTLSEDHWNLLTLWDQFVEQYRQEKYSYTVRQQKIEINTHVKSLSRLSIPKVALPKYRAWGDILRWCVKENAPGQFPYTAGIYPFKRQGESPTRMFAGEGGPERTNLRFHYISKDMPYKRLSTAFDSVTLYGDDPDYRPDIYGKIGNAGVSVCSLDDAKRLYSGFNLCDPKTSVSMTINGPAPMLLAFFLHAAIDQQCELYLRESIGVDNTLTKIEDYYQGHEKLRPTYAETLPPGNDGLGLLLLGICGNEILPQEEYHRIKAHTLHQVRGTLQADILKEDQAQNTCLFSTPFALRLMGDVQQYFIDEKVKNFYSVSISGYHIAEAGANPITQLAFTLANGFTYVEYYLHRGMHIDDFAPNFSFFFSNGVDQEYAVIGRVARRIWAKALKFKYGGNARSQKLKYHIQTSGRSLHAQEISFNDIRTTLQALYAIYDNCNSLHTNAYDEAITTPTEESVRRAMAIQLIIDKELGLAKNENPLQGSFIIEELTDLVEEATLIEFDRISERGGVLGAMETMYQRGQIQEESLLYESLKHSGEYPIIGVNTFLGSSGSPTIVNEKNVIRAYPEEKDLQISRLKNLHAFHKKRSHGALKDLQEASLNNKNVFYALMEAAKVCSLGQLTNTLFVAGGQYRRNM